MAKREVSILVCGLPFFYNSIVENDKKTAISWFSKAVRTIGHCEHCGSYQELTCSHIISCGFDYTRTSFRNAHCLCWQCHRYFTDNPRKFKNWVRTTWAGEYMESEKWKSLATMAIVPVDWKNRTRISKLIVQGKVSLFEARLKDL